MTLRGTDSLRSYVSSELLSHSTVLKAFVPCGNSPQEGWVLFFLFFFLSSFVLGTQSSSLRLSSDDLADKTTQFVQRREEGS